MSAPSPSHDYLKLEQRGAVAIIRFDWPQRLNALHASVWSTLRRHLDTLVDEGRTRALVLTGSGDKAFSAGGDIEGFAQLATLDAKRAFQQDAMRCFAALETAPLPTIAAVNGWALGGGCELTLACDIVLASERARFGMPEAARGLVPGYGVLRAPSLIGRQATKRLVMAAEIIDAEEARRLGLVQQVLPHDQLLPEALALAERIAANSALAIRVGKTLIDRDHDRAAFDHSVEALTVLQASGDAGEGIAAFLEKRKADFPSHRRG